MTDPTPKQLAMARRIAADGYYPLREDRMLPTYARERVLSGDMDHTVQVQTVLAAIIETSERAAKWHERRMHDRFAEHGTREPDTNATYYSGRYGETLETLDEEDEASAAAIRKGNHLDD